MSFCSGLSREQSNKLYREVLRDDDQKAMRDLVLNDLFFLLTVACKRKDIDKDWLYDRCREVEESPDGHLDLWAREHYKSTIITFGLSIQDILNDPDNTTIGIFSHTRPIAKAFLAQIKSELESNSFLQDLFPEVLFKAPKSDAPRWSLDSGIVVKRKTNPKESTVEAHGLVDGQPTSKHFSLLIYDDVVTRESVFTPDQIKKTTESWELSLNLAAQGGKKRYIGTRYHANDTYRTMMDRGSVKVRLKPAREGGKMDGRAVFMDDDELKEKRRDMGPYTFGSQMLQDPVADRSMGFKRDWLEFYSNKLDLKKMNIYIVADPANTKKRNSDYTVMNVIGLGPDNNYYLIDGFRDRLNLTERTERLFDLHRKYNPVKVGYESYGMQSDIDHIKYVMDEKNYRFNIVSLGGSMAKEDRIKRLVPIYEQRRMFFPKQLHFIDYEGKHCDYVDLFINNEYLAFPVAVHDDMLDAEARILDPLFKAEFPTKKKQKAYSSESAGWCG